MGGRGVGLSTGTVVRYDRTRGYGFIAPDEGGDDVFVHAEDLSGDGPVDRGMRVAFDTVDGDRGLRARCVRVLLAGVPVPADRTGDEDLMADVLSPAQYGREVTDVLLNVVCAATAAQIVEARERLTALASRHGWVE